MTNDILDVSLVSFSPRYKNFFQSLQFEIRYMENRSLSSWIKILHYHLIVNVRQIQWLVLMIIFEATFGEMYCVQYQFMSLLMGGRCTIVFVSKTAPTYTVRTDITSSTRSSPAKTKCIVSQDVVLSIICAKQGRGSVSVDNTDDVSIKEGCQTAIFALSSRR